MQLCQHTLSLMCVMAGEPGSTTCAQLWKKRSRKRWEMDLRTSSTTVSKVCEMPFLFAGGAAIRWSNRKYTVRFGEETWCLPLYGRQVLRPLPDAGARDSGWLLPYPFLWAQLLCAVIKGPLHSAAHTSVPLCPLPLERGSPLFFQLILFLSREGAVELSVEHPSCHHLFLTLS